MLLLALGAFAAHPVLRCDLELPEDCLAAVESQSKGVYSPKLPLLPLFVRVDSYTDGVVRYTIHYFPFGTLGMSYRAGEGYNIEKPLSGWS